MRVIIATTCFLLASAAYADNPILGIIEGGTGANNASAARTNLGAAERGANSDINAISGLTTPLSIPQGGTGATDPTSARTAIGAMGVGGTLVPGNVVVGATGGVTVQDSGNQLIKTGVAARAPSLTDDSTQGYSLGSIWVNTATGALFVAVSVTPSAASWTAATPTATFSYQSAGWAFLGPATGATVYTAPGGVGVNVNQAALVTRAATMSDLYIHTAAAPGTGNTFTVTLFTGAPTAEVASPVTCTISGTATGCSDTTHSVAVTAGQGWTVQIISSPSATSAAASSAGVQLKF